VSVIQRHVRIQGILIPEHSQTLLSVAVLSTVFFEIIGPIFTRIALARVEHA